MRSLAPAAILAGSSGLSLLFEETLIKVNRVSSMMICQVCQNIDFEAAHCCPDTDAGASQAARHQPSYQNLISSASNGCELCSLIQVDLAARGPPIYPRLIKEALTQPMFCNVWNYYDGPAAGDSGSAEIIFWVQSRTLGLHLTSMTVHLAIAVEPDSPLAIRKVVSGRRAHLSANSDSCIEMMKRWIAGCLREHEDSCSYDSNTKLPTRVIDVGLEASAPNVKLIETQNIEGSWVALSHCWGRIARFVTETSTVDDRKRGITLSELPATFRDAVLITRRLGYRYLWIDSLCILQDSSVDWVEESGHMQDYYSKAVLTIASDLAEGDHEGFLDVARAQDRWIEIPSATKDDRGSTSSVYISTPVRVTGFQRTQQELNKRGWTLQEDILSPRSLHFTHTEVFLECQATCLTETDATPQGHQETDFSESAGVKRYFLHPEIAFTNPTMTSYHDYWQPLSRWYRLFKDYCSRKLTFESDRLAAIAGLAKEIQKQTQFEYKSGIWMEDIHKGLLWAVNGRGTKASEYRAPSWSWASLDINFHWGDNVEIQAYKYDLYSWTNETKPDSSMEKSREAQIVDCEVETVNGNPFAPVIHASLRLRGYMLPLNEWRGDSEKRVNVWWRQIKSHQPYGFFLNNSIGQVQATDQLLCDYDIDCLPDEDEVEAEDEGETDVKENTRSADSNHSLDLAWPEYDYPTNVVLFQVRRQVNALEREDFNGEHNEHYDYLSDRGIFFSLMLELVDFDEGATPTYRRVGLAQVPDVGDLAREGWFKREIVIV